MHANVLSTTILPVRHGRGRNVGVLSMCLAFDVSQARSIDRINYVVLTRLFNYVGFFSTCLENYAHSFKLTESY